MTIQGIGGGIRGPGMNPGMDPQDRFKRVDKNGDGGVQFDEFKEMNSMLGALSGRPQKTEAARNVFSWLDKDQDGSLTPEELAAGESLQQTQKESGPSSLISAMQGRSEMNRTLMDFLSQTGNQDQVIAEGSGSIADSYVQQAMQTYNSMSAYI